MRSSVFTSRLTATTVLAGMVMGFSGAVYAAPVLDSVVTAGVTVDNITGSGNVTVNQGSVQRGIVNWQTFDVKKTETVEFVQPSANAVMLNRVTGDVKASEIHGSIKANGQVAIVNPNGVLFGKNAKVDVAGLVATSADISDEDFQNGDMNFTKRGADDALVENRGMITAKEAGLVALVSPRVKNSGVITARKGTVALAGAQKVTLDMNGDGLISFAPDNIQGKASGADAVDVTSSGQLIADGGRVYITAKDAADVVDHVVNMQGVVQANTLREENGDFVIGVVEINSGHQGALIGGRVSANGGAGKGGNITVRGKNVTIKSTARQVELDASGAQGGQVELRSKQALVVGDAEAETVPGEGAGHKVVVAANGTDGDAGTILLASYNDAKTAKTTVTGDAQFEARGANKGGSLEVSGDHIQFSGTAELYGENERGVVTFDPDKIWINDGGFDGVTDHVSEKFIEGQLQSGTDVVILANKEIHLNNLSDGELTGGSGDFTLMTRDLDGKIVSSSKHDAIYSSQGDVYLRAGGGGIDVGDIRISSNSQAGAVRLKTTDGGSIAVRDLSVQSGGVESIITVNADGDVSARSLSSTVSSADVKDIAARIYVKSAGDVTVDGNVSALAEGLAGDEALSTTDLRSSVTINAERGIVIGADASTVTTSAWGAESRTHALLRLNAGDAISVDHSQAHATGGGFAHTLVDFAAPTVTITDDIESLAVTDAGAKKAAGFISVAGELFAHIKDKVTDLHATTGVDVLGDIHVVDATAFSDADYVEEAFRMIANNYVKVVGNIDSVLSSVVARAGKGGIEVGNIVTGNSAETSSDELYASAFHSLGDIDLQTAKGSGGNVTTGVLGSYGTAGMASAYVYADGNAHVQAVDVRLTNPRGETTSVADVTLRAAKDVHVTGDISVLVDGRDAGYSNNSAALLVKAGENLVVGNATVQAQGGADARTSLKVESVNGTVSVGSLLAQSNSEEGGRADTYLSIIAPGTSAEDDGTISYTGATPTVRANGLELVNRYDDIASAANARAEISIVKKPTDGGGTDGGSGGGLTPVTPAPTDPIEGPTIPPIVTPVKPIPTPASPSLALGSLALEYETGMPQGYYSFYGSTMGDQYYYGSARVNLSLLSKGNKSLANMSPEALGGLAPAAGGNAASNQDAKGACANNYLDAGYAPSYQNDRCEENDNGTL